MPCIYLSIYCLFSLGGRQSRQTELGAPQRRAPRSHYRRGQRQQGQTQARAGRRGGQEITHSGKLFVLTVKWQVKSYGSNDQLNSITCTN